MKNLLTDSEESLQARYSAAETAPLPDLWRWSTLSQRSAAEKAATAAMARVADPVAGAREIILAAHLRAALRAEIRGVLALFS